MHALTPHGAVAKFCKDTGFSRASVQRWEAGQSPTLETLDRVAAGIGSKSWELINPGAEAPKVILEAAEPTNTKLGEWIREVSEKLDKTIEIPSDPLIREAAVILRELDDTKRGDALAWLRSFSRVTKGSNEKLNKRGDAR